MNILVCVKMVLDADQKPVMGAGDAYALEEALRIKDSMGAHVTALSLGPPDSGAVLTRALAMGADAARHIESSGPSRPSGEVLARALAHVARDETHPFDLLFCGVSSGDSGSGRIGPMLAAILDLPMAGCVVDVAPSPERNSVTVTRQIEAGRALLLEVGLPAVLTIQTFTRQPRYPSLSRLLAANRAIIPKIPFHSLPKTPPYEILLGLGPPCAVPAGEMLTGAMEEKAARLLEIFRDRGLL